MLFVVGVKLGVRLAVAVGVAVGVEREQHPFPLTQTDWACVLSVVVPAACVVLTQLGTSLPSSIGIVPASQSHAVNSVAHWAEHAPEPLHLTASSVCSSQAALSAGGHVGVGVGVGVFNSHAPQLLQVPSFATSTVQDSERVL